MDKDTKKQLWIGGIITVAIFLAIFGVISGVNYAGTFLAGQSTVEEAIDTETQTALTETKTSAGFVMPQNEIILLFPLIVETDTSSTEIILQNNSDQKIDNISITAIGSRGDWHTYRSISVEPNIQYTLSLKNLANLPQGMDPGTIILAADQPIAGVAKVSNTNGIANNPTVPYLVTERDLYFDFTRSSAGEIEQNALIVTNISDTLAEVQLSFSKAGERSAISDPIEIPPHHTKLIRLADITDGTTELATFDSLIVSASAPSIIAALTEVDTARTTWQNILTGKPK